MFEHAGEAHAHGTNYQYNVSRFLGILMDANVVVRNAARKILGQVNLPKLRMFKSALDGLIAGLEKNLEDQDIYGVLFSIGKNHGSFSAKIAKHLAKEVFLHC
uniref:Uncharacterized protein n=1 Tax=Triticum urartu TaxID=4572 RepID=A0A8R7QS30_TRIUA